jgi:hypothetical protein
MSYVENGTKRQASAYSENNGEHAAFSSAEVFACYHEARILNVHHP